MLKAHFLANVTKTKVLVVQNYWKHHMTTHEVKKKNICEIPPHTDLQHLVLETINHFKSRNKLLLTSQDNECKSNWQTVKQCNHINYSCPDACWEELEWTEPQKHFFTLGLFELKSALIQLTCCACGLNFKKHYFVIAKLQ